MTLHLILFLLKRSEAVRCAGSDVKQLQYNILWSALQKLNKSISKGKITLFRVFWWAGGIKHINGFKFLKFYNHYTSHSSQFCVHTPVPLCFRLFAWHYFFCLLLLLLSETVPFTAATLFTTIFSFLFIVHLPLCVFFSQVLLLHSFHFLDVLYMSFECQCFYFLFSWGDFHVMLNCGKSAKLDSQDHTFTKMNCQVYFYYSQKNPYKVGIVWAIWTLEYIYPNPQSCTVGQ